MATIPENIIVLWPGNHSAIPSGWSRETSLDDKFFRGRTSGNAGNGGGNTHNHSSSSHTHGGANHTHSATTGASNRNFGTWAYHPNNKRSLGPVAHTHTETTSSTAGGTSGGATPSWDTPTAHPEYYEMIAIVSDGTPSGFPDGCVVWYNAGSAPTDWTNHAGSREKFIKPATTSGNSGGTGGGSHTHSGTSHTHPAPNATHDHSGGQIVGTQQNSTSTSTGCDCGSTSTVQCWQTPQSHLHNWDVAAGTAGSAGGATSPASGGTTYQPPYHILLGIENTSGGDNWLEEAIVMWLGAAGSPPDDWTLCNGGNNASGNATPDLDGKYILMAASGGGDVGNTGGSAGHTHSNPSSHTHSQSHGHTFPATGGTPNGGATAGSNNRDPYSTNHFHVASNATANTTAYSGTAQSISSTANTEPAYRTVAYLSSPEEPAGGNMAIFGTNF